MISTAVKRVTELILRQPILAAALIFFPLGFLIYSNTFGVTPRFDDSIFIFDRIQVRDIGRIWTEGDLYRKIPYLTFALNYRWTGQAVWSWHLVNLLLHLATTLVVYGIARAAWRSRALSSQPLSAHAGTLSLLSALLFLCHPIQTSAVTYIYQRMIVIATLFHALTLYGYLKIRIDGRRAYWVLFAGAGILACFTKQVNMSLPLTLLLTEIAFCSESPVAFLKRSIRFIPLAAVPVGLYVWMIKPDLSRLSLDTLKGLYPLNSNSGMSWGEWIPTQINVMRTYLRLLIFPMNQTLDYDYPVSHSLREPSVIVSLAVLAAVFGIGIWCWRRHRAISWGIFFMTAALSLEFFAIRDIIFEHRLYLSMIGFVIAAPSALYAFLGDRKRSGVLALAILSALSVAAFARNSVWADEERFWKEEVRLSPNKGRPYYSLGVYYALRGEHDRAAPLYQRAISIWPNFADAYSNLGKSLEELGQTEESVLCYAKAVALDPTLPEGLNNYGSALVRQGKYDQARLLYEEAIRRKPDNFEAYSNMGSVYARQKNYKEAESWYRRSIAANPLHADAHNNLGSILGMTGDAAGAERSYLEAVRLRPDFFEAHSNLAVLSTRQKQYELAIREFLEMLRIQPDSVEGHNNLASLLARQKRYEEAEAHYLKALELWPNYVDAMKSLVNVYRLTGRSADERILLDRIRELEKSADLKEKSVSKSGEEG